jgi:hypothetical protein
MRTLLLLEWADAHDGTETWTAIDDLIDDGEVVITSVGIQLDEDKGGKKGHVALAQSIDGDHVDNVLYVPVGMIRKMTVLQFDGVVQ